MKLFGKKIKTSAVVGFCAVLVTVCVPVFVTVSRKSAKKEAQQSRQRGNTVVSVSTMTANEAVLNDYVLANGEVESQNSVSVFADMGGKIISTSVVLGSVVKKGDVIAYVDPSEPGTNYRASPVYAPISGSVISTPLKNGTKVSTSSVLAVIGDIRNLQITANVPERYVSVLRTGLKANVSVEAYPDVVFSATVASVSPVVDSVSRTKQIILNFDRRDERINAGMFAKVKLYTQDYGGKVVVPNDAVVQNGDDFYMYVVNDDSTVSRRHVTKGNYVDGMVQILDGIESGEKVVVQGMTSLGDGSKILDVSEKNRAED